MDATAPFRISDKGLLVYARVQPGASTNRVEGVVVAADDSRRLALKVTAPADKGKANKAATKLIAKNWKLPASSIEIVAGASQRNKTLLIAGDGEALLTRLQEWLKKSAK